MRAVDTNVLVRLIVRGNEAQVAAAEAFVAPGAWVSHLALAEAAWVLVSVYERSAGQVGATIEALLGHEALTLQEPDVVRSALARLRIAPRLGFSDCLMLEVAIKVGHTPVGTFDKALGRLDGAQRL